MQYRNGLGNGSLGDEQHAYMSVVYSNASSAISCATLVAQDASDSNILAFQAPVACAPSSALPHAATKTATSSLPSVHPSASRTV